MQVGFGALRAHLGEDPDNEGETVAGVGTPPEPNPFKEYELDHEWLEVIVGAQQAVESDSLNFEALDLEDFAPDLVDQARENEMPTAPGP